MIQRQVKQSYIILSRCNLTHVLFIPLPAEMIQFDWYFSNGLKPPTSYICVLFFVLSSHLRVDRRATAKEHQRSEPEASLSGSSRTHSSHLDGLETSLNMEVAPWMIFLLWKIPRWKKQQHTSYVVSVWKEKTCFFLQWISVLKEKEHPSWMSAMTACFFEVPSIPPCRGNMAWNQGIFTTIIPLDVRHVRYPHEKYSLNKS